MNAYDAHELVVLGYVNNNAKFFLMIIIRQLISCRIIVIIGGY